MEAAQQEARVRKGKMVLVEEDSEEWEPPYNSTGSVEEDSDATLSDGVADQFEIRSRGPRLSDSAHQPILSGQVRQVVQAFEAGSVVVDGVGGVGTLASTIEVPALIDEYGSNTLVMGMGGRKHSWEDINGEVEGNPTVKKQFVEEVGNDELISVEVASRKCPQGEK
ncbi:unnamed protein product [Linum trigynum]|uniref:Uncharacterized protein n=1 Tax=Linum trigynum TaxID=586398 RepID=A0AAV2EAT5_9ROSI